MKYKRFSTEDKIRILRQVDQGRSAVELCAEHNLSQVSFYRWKKKFGQMDVNEAKRLKELERENPYARSFHPREKLSFIPTP